MLKGFVTIDPNNIWIKLVRIIPKWEGKPAWGSSRWRVIMIKYRKCEGLIMIDSRWLKLKKEFYDSDTKKYNISKIPDIYDTIRHDLRKNSAIFKKINQQILDSLH